MPIPTPHRSSTRHPWRPSAAALLALVALLAVTAGACSSSIAEDPVLRLSSEEALVEGKRLMAEEKFNRARKYLSQAFEVEPNSRSGREGLLLLADSYYLAGNNANWIQAEAKYRDFLNRFPTSDQAAYAQYQIANSLASRVEKANRDQSSTFKALQAYQELQRLYPTSEYALEAEAKIIEVRNQLAAHEFVVGDFYLRYRYPSAAITRFNRLLDAYPNYDERDRVLYRLGIAYSESRNVAEWEKAEPTFERLREEYPGSDWIAKIPDELPPKPEPLRFPGSETAEPTPASSGEEAAEEAAQQVADPETTGR